MVQLAKLPLLVQHFTEHKNNDSDLSLWKFLCMHYYDDDKQDGDDDKDLRLPFKSHKDCVNTIVVGFVSNHFPDLIRINQFSETKNYIIYNQNFLTSAYLSFIWQPPKAC